MQFLINVIAIGLFAAFWTAVYFNQTNPSGLVLQQITEAGNLPSTVTMKISFQIRQEETLPELLFCWRMAVEAARETAVLDTFIPELFFDFFYVQEGALSCVGAGQYEEGHLPRQVLKTLHSRRLDFVLELPLILYGARFTLPFAELFWQEQMPANAFLRQTWVEESVPDLKTFTTQISAAIESRRVKKTVAPMLLPVAGRNFLVGRLFHPP